MNTTMRNADETPPTGIFDPEAIRRYKELTAIKTIPKAVRKIAALDRDVAQLRGCGDEAAVCGATALMRRAVVDMMAIPALSLKAHEAKLRCLTAHAHEATPEWLVDPMIGLAIKLDWQDLHLTHDQERRMAALLPREGESG